MAFRTPPRSRIREEEDLDRVAALRRDIRHLEYLVRQARLDTAGGGQDVQKQALARLAEEDLRRKRDELIALAPMAVFYPPDDQPEVGASAPQDDEVVELELPSAAFEATDAADVAAPPQPQPRTLGERIRAIHQQG
jgi:hypothetical protein